MNIFIFMFKGKISGYALVCLFFRISRIL